MNLSAIEIDFKTTPEFECNWNQLKKTTLEFECNWNQLKKHQNLSAIEINLKQQNLSGIEINLKKQQ